jgi:hypothetical protein
MCIVRDNEDCGECSNVSRLVKVYGQREVRSRAKQLQTHNGFVETITNVFRLTCLVTCRMLTVKVIVFRISGILTCVVGIDEVGSRPRQIHLIEFLTETRLQTEKMFMGGLVGGLH